MQVQELCWICLQYLMYSLSTDTVLEAVQLAEELSDSILMDACIQYLTESDHRYSSLPCSIVHLFGPCSKCNSFVIVGC